MGSSITVNSSSMSCGPASGSGASSTGGARLRGSISGQLDLFAHSRTVILINDVVDCILERNAERAAGQLQLLRTEAPGHPALDALGTLCDALARWPVRTIDARETARVVDWLESKVAVSATTSLGASAPAFMGSLWRDLAAAVAAHAYDTAYPRSYCAYCYLRAGDARAALWAANAIAGADLDPCVLQWKTLASYGVGGLRASRVPLFSLALARPQELPPVMAAIADPDLNSDWDRFWIDCIWLDPRDTSAAAWFPAWYLIEHPATGSGEAIASSDPDAPPMRAFEAMRRVVAAEPGGYGGALMLARAELRRIDVRLFRHYMHRLESHERCDRKVGRMFSNQSDST